MNNSALRDCFADSAVNLGRQQEIDLARAIPVFFLPAVHTVIECTPVEHIYDLLLFFRIVIRHPFGEPMFYLRWEHAFIFLDAKIPSVL